MPRLFPDYPAGPTGVALLLLRFSVIESILVNAPILDFHVASVCRDFLILAIVVGFVTPVAALLWGVSEGFRLFGGEPVAAAFAVAAIFKALALARLGPGAYSVDGRLFGRRAIVFSSSGNPRYR